MQTLKAVFSNKKSVELMLGKLEKSKAKEQDIFLKAKMLIRESVENQAGK